MRSRDYVVIFLLVLVHVKLSASESGDLFMIVVPPYKWTDFLVQDGWNVKSIYGPIL